MRLLDLIRNALRLPGSTPSHPIDQDITEIRRRQHEQINRLQRLYGDRWSQLKRESWLYPRRPPSSEEPPC